MIHIRKNIASTCGDKLATKALIITPMGSGLKIVAVILLLVTAYFASIGVGVFRLTSSEIFPFAKKALNSYLVSTNSKNAGETFHLKWFAPWQFTANSSKGLAQFLLCTPKDDCYPVTAEKIDGVWQIDWTFQGTFANSSR